MIKVDFISPKNQGGIVNSVNGKSGAVNLTAEDVGALSKYTEIPSSEDFATKEQLRDYATTDYVDEAIIQFPETGIMKNYYTKAETDVAYKNYFEERIDKIEMPEPDLTGYATEEYVDNAVGGIVIPTPDFTGYATETYVDNAIAAIPEVDLTGFYDKEEIDAMLEEAGGSVSVDGTTIIQNEDGTISTTIGGGKELITPSEDVYEYTNAEGVTRPDENTYRVYFYTSDSLYSTVFDRTLQYDIDVDIYDATTGITETVSGYMTNVSTYTWNCYGDLIDGVYGIKEFYCSNSYYNNADGVGYQNYFSIKYNGSLTAFVSNQHYITRVKFKTSPVYEYVQIDKAYIPQLISIEPDVEYNSVIQTSNSKTQATNTQCAALGANNTVAGQGCIALGRDNKQYSSYGMQISVGDGNASNTHTTFAFGSKNTMYTSNSMALGFSNEVRSSYQTVLGKKCTPDGLNTYALIVGVDGSNGFTLDWSGNGAFAGTVSSTGADYAEYFEWLDGNPEGEDRVGYIVALDGDKIRKAVPGDEVLGVISGTIAVLGDNYEWQWQGKYLTDDFGRVLVDMVEEFGEEGESLGFFPCPRINPAYNPEEEYIPRAKRKEWDAVGMMGKLFVRDDGKAQPNDYITVGADGVATVSAEKTNMRMLSRKGDNIIRILMK